MLDFDFFSDTIEIGSHGRFWRNVWAVAGILIGAGIAVYIGYLSDGWRSAVVGAPVGALFGFVGAMFLRGFAILLLIGLVIFGVVFAFNYLT